KLIYKAFLNDIHYLIPFFFQLKSKIFIIQQAQKVVKINFIIKVFFFVIFHDLQVIYLRFSHFYYNRKYHQIKKNDLFSVQKYFLTYFLIITYFNVSLFFKTFILTIFISFHKNFYQFYLLKVFFFHLFLVQKYNLLKLLFLLFQVFVLKEIPFIPIFIQPFLCIFYIIFHVFFSLFISFITLLLLLIMIIALIIVYINPLIYQRLIL
ncbi:hypothetical protein IMG5_136630, partial [Ichthyophthirius multifiliis]